MQGIDKASLPTFESLGLSQQQKPLEQQQQHLKQEDFMKLMMAQMNHQDPMKPMENGEFITQMAQFSAVHGLKEIKDSFGTLANALQSSQALQASSMVGRKVLIPGKATELVADAGLRGGVDVPQETEQVMVKILDKSGQQVHSIDLGARGPGTVNFSWDGVIKPAAEGVPGAQPEIAAPGKYTVVAEILSEGKAQAVDTFVVDKVDSVSLAKGGQGVTLNLANSGATLLADVREIL